MRLKLRLSTAEFCILRCAYPLLIAAAVGVATIALAAGVDWTTRDTLVITHVNGAPKLDGVLDDDVWAKTRPVYVQTQQGANLGGTGDRRIRATQGTFLFIPPGVPHNIVNATDKPARVLMTVSPPGHENYFEELANAVARDSPPDVKAIAELRGRYDTDQLSALKS